MDRIKIINYVTVFLFGTNLLLLASCNFTRKESPPNILFVISDDQSYFHTGKAGCNWIKTPNFDLVADQGIYFSNCYTPNAKCAPSRSTIITGRNSWQLEAAGNHVSVFPEKFISFFETIDSLTDYCTGYTGKGVEPVNPQGRQLTGKSYNDIKLVPPANFISNTDYAANFESFLAEKSKNKPFLFWFGAREPHRPYEFGAGSMKGNKIPEEINQVPGFWPDSLTVRHDMLDYAFEIEYFDKQLGRFIEILKERKELANTVIIVTSDNGMPFPRCKGFEYEYSNHMPLAIMWPEGIKHSRRSIDDYISFIDFAPTILELAGVQNPELAGMKHIQGNSILPILTSSKEGQVIPERNYVLLGQERHDVGRPDDLGYPIRSIIMDGLLYIHNFEPSRWPACNPEAGYLNTDGSPTKSLILEMRRKDDIWEYWDLCFDKHTREELYDIKSDPYCLNNLAGNIKYSEEKERLKSRFFEELKNQGDPRILGDGSIFDSYPYADSMHRNFYNRYMKGEISEFITSWVSQDDFEPDSIVKR